MEEKLTHVTLSTSTFIKGFTIWNTNSISEIRYSYMTYDSTEELKFKLDTLTWLQFFFIVFFCFVKGPGHQFKIKSAHQNL